MIMSDRKPTWTKPELTKLGTLKDVAGGKFLGADANGKGTAKSPIS